MDLASSFHSVVAIARGAEDAASGWLSLIGFLERESDMPFSDLRSIDAQEDVLDVRYQLEQLLAAESPPNDLNAIYFGLFDTADEDGEEGIGYYVAGVQAFDPADGDSLCARTWWPDGRYLSSRALEAIKSEELSSAAKGHAETRRLLGYAGQLGAAALISRFASEGVLPALRRVVGFDSGDFVELVP